MKTLPDAIARALAEANAQRNAKDAERYRKMRRQAFGGEPEPWQAEEFDAAIDAEDA